MFRPYSTFSIKPFLFVDEKSLKSLQSKFLELSRSYHPDRHVNSTTEEKEEAEAMSAQINSDYAKLRDQEKLLTAVLSSKEKCPVRNQTPPEFAHEYFDLQESMEEKDPNAGQKLKAFVTKIDEKMKAMQEKIQKFTQRFPYEESNTKITSFEVPWTDKDLQELSTFWQELSYIKSFKRDILARYG